MSGWAKATSLVHVPVSPVQTVAWEVRCIMGVVWGVALVMVLTA